MSASFERQRQTSVPLCWETYPWFNQSRYSFGEIKLTTDSLPESCMIFVCGSQLAESCTWYLFLKINSITINGFILDSYRMVYRQEIINDCIHKITNKIKTIFSDIFLPFACIVYAIDRDYGTKLYTQEKRAKLLIIQSSKLNRYK